MVSDEITIEMTRNRMNEEVTAPILNQLELQENAYNDDWLAEFVNFSHPVEFGLDTIIFMNVGFIDVSTLSTNLNDHEGEIQGRVGKSKMLKRRSK